MATSPHPGTSGDEVGRRTFSTSFRGFDQGEVRAYLEVVAAEFATLQARVADLERELEEAARPAATPTLDAATLTSMVGEETARVLRAAQEAAEDLRTRAEEGAARTLTEAHEEAARIRNAADSVLAARTAEAEKTAAAIRAEAHEKADKVTHEARADADRVVHDAVEQGRDMVGQAQAARERVLGDLARRRRAALAQVEQLREGRERLVASLANVRTELDRITHDLAMADEVARQAAEVASRSVRKEPSEPEGNEPEGKEPERNEAGGNEAGVTAGFEPGDRPGSAGLGIDEVGALPMPAPEPAPVAEPPAPEPADIAPPVIEAPAPAAPAIEAPAIEAPAEAGAAVAPPAVVASADPADVMTDALVAEEALISAPRKPGRRIKEPIPAPPGPARPAYAHDEVPAAALPGAAVGTPAPVEAGEVRDVDDLFARIRADRAVATDEARAALAPEAVPVHTDPPKAEPAKSEPAKAEPASSEAARSEPAASGPAKAGAAAETSRPPKSGKRKRAATNHPAAAAPAGAGADRGLEAPRSDADETYLQRRDVLVEVVQSTTGRALRRCLADDQNAALDRFRTLRADIVGVDALLGPESDQRQEWTRRASPGLADGAAAGSNLATAGTGPTPDPAVVTPIAERLAADLVTALRSRLEMVLESVGKDRGPDTVDRINSVFRERRSRIDRAVGDAVTEAVSAGFTSAAPAGTHVTWVVEDVDGPCPDCDDNALAGAISLGELFPTGQAAPPAHPGCRCVLSRATT